MPNAAARLSQMDSSSARVKNRKNRLNSRIAKATMKKTLPCRPFLTSAVISARASSTSARTSVETCLVASPTSPPIDLSSVDGTGSGASGIDGSTGGTPALSELVGLDTAVLLVLGSVLIGRPSFHADRADAP